MLFSKYRSIAENSIIPFERSITTVQQQETCGGAQTSDATGLRLDCPPQLIHAPTLLRAQICDALEFLECCVGSAPEESPSSQAFHCKSAPIFAGALCATK